MTTISSRNYDYLNYLILFVLAFIYISIFSLATTPFTIVYPLDSTNFLVMGKMLVDGKIPFVDFFDHKGPSLILLEAVAQIFISGRFGIYIFQIFHLFFTFLFIWKTARLVLRWVLKFDFSGFAEQKNPILAQCVPMIVKISEYIARFRYISFFL